MILIDSFGLEPLLGSPFFQTARGYSATVSVVELYLVTQGESHV